MEVKNIQGINLFYAPQESETAHLVEETLLESIRLLTTHWGLDKPQNIEVHVMTSWVGFSFASAPAARRVFLALFFPFWALRAYRSWRYAAGWALQYKNKAVIGVKPARLIKRSHSGLGAELFPVPVDLEESLRSTTCHELTHAFSGHLRLPVWLHEGLAILTSEFLLGKPAVLPQTAARLPEMAQNINSKSYRRVKKSDLLPLLYQYARSYWLVRYLEDTQPALLRELLRRPMAHAQLEERLAEAFILSPEEFWAVIDEKIRDFYRET